MDRKWWVVCNWRVAQVDTVILNTPGLHGINFTRKCFIIFLFFNFFFFFYIYYYFIIYYIYIFFILFYFSSFFFFSSHFFWTWTWLKQHTEVNKNYAKHKNSSQWPRKNICHVVKLIALLIIKILVINK